jgi:hypothetical protein
VSLEISGEWSGKEHLKMGNKFGKLQSNTSSNMAYCKIPSTAIHGPLNPIFYPLDKANIIAYFLENQFRGHDLCNCEIADMWRLKS